MHAKNIFSLSEKKFITGCEHSITFWALKFLILGHRHIWIWKVLLFFYILNTIVYIQSFYLVLIWQLGRDIT